MEVNNSSTIRQYTLTSALNQTKTDHGRVCIVIRCNNTTWTPTIFLVIPQLGSRISKTQNPRKAPRLSESGLSLFIFALDKELFFSTAAGRELFLSGCWCNTYRPGYDRSMERMLH